MAEFLLRHRSEDQGGEKQQICQQRKTQAGVIRPALTYGSECWAMKVNNKGKIAITEMTMLCGIFGVLRRDHKRNEEIRCTLQVAPIDEVVCSGRVFVCFQGYDKR